MIDDDGLRSVLFLKYRFNDKNFRFHICSSYGAWRFELIWRLLQVFSNVPQIIAQPLSLKEEQISTYFSRWF